jgi:hypothetical protein
MGTRSIVACLALAAAITACSEQQESESVAGPSLAGRPTDPAACDPNSLNSLLSGYFPGNSGSVARTAKDAMLAATTKADTLEQGFKVLQEIGNLSRQQAVDTVAGSSLAQGIIKCMYDATSFTPTFPTDPIYNFAPALSANNGGAFYTRGSGTGANTTVHGAAGVIAGTPDILSGVNPLTGSWATVLAGSPAGKALIYGYRVTSNPLVYEWATIPPATQFAGGAVVALCDGSNASTAMVHESNIGVLGYQSASPICDATYSVAIKQTGWGPRALASRLARVVVDALQPQPLQAVALKSGTGGTATTFKSKIKKETVQTVTLAFAPDPPATLNVKKMPYLVRVLVTSDVIASPKGTNGVCVYLTGTNNNGINTALSGNTECDNTATGGVSAITKSVLINNVLTAGYAEFQLNVTKNGGLIITASSTDAEGKTGVIERDGQTFGTDFVKTNVKP